MTVRQYELLIGFDQQTEESIMTWDVTNGKIRMYNPDNLGMSFENNVYYVGGQGIKGTLQETIDPITFDLVTFEDTIEENYKTLDAFANSLMSGALNTFKMTRPDGVVMYFDFVVNSIPRQEGYFKDGSFITTIEIQPINKWYQFERVVIRGLPIPDMTGSIGKVYDDSGSGYLYDSASNAYVYGSEDDAERFAVLKVENQLMSVNIIGLINQDNAPSTTGIIFKDVYDQEYSRIVFEFDSLYYAIKVDTDVNDEMYDYVFLNNDIDGFDLLDQLGYTTRQIKKGSVIEFLNITEASIIGKTKEVFS